MKLQQLRILLTVQETGSLQEASRILHVTQPALSRAIKELEAELGVMLLVRSNRGVTLTAYGERLLVHARHALEDLRRARLDIEEMKGQANRDIAVGVTSATAALPPVRAAISAFLASHARARLHLRELRPAQVLAALREGTLDFGLISQLPAQPSPLQWELICRLPTQILAGRRHPLRNARSLHELHGAHWQTADDPEDPNSVFYQLFQQNGLVLPERITECSSLLLSSHLLTEGDSIALLARMSYEPGVLPSLAINEQLQAIAIAEPIPDAYVSMVCVDHALMTGSAARLFELLHTALIKQYPRFG